MDCPMRYHPLSKYSSRSSPESEYGVCFCVNISFCSIESVNIPLPSGKIMSLFLLFKISMMKADTKIIISGIYWL